MRITLGSVLTITATDFRLNTGAGPTEDLVSFVSVAAEVKIGSMILGGAAQNFSFTGDGSFEAKQGFGVVLNLGGADGNAFKWPTWLPIRITSLGVQWTDPNAHPEDFTIVMSAAVTSIKGIPNLEFTGAIDGIRIDVGELLAGRNPIVGVDAIAVQVKGNLFGGELNAALLGGILRLTEGGTIIQAFDQTTPVAERIFYLGIEGGFSFAGLGGFSIRLGLSELGPLTVQISASVPGGILLEPITGLSMNDFVAGVEFFKTLPSIDDPFQLRGPAFNVPAAMPADEWLATIQQQVAAQYLVLKNNPGMSGFTAAFTAPMTIVGSAKIFTIYTSKEVFNGQVIVKFSTDGKILVVGKLNFAADNISVSGRLFADLSRVSSGDVTVLFLADVPYQIRILTLYGRLNMGFRNASGQEVEFIVPDEPPATPTPTLVGPRPGDGVALSDINGRGFVDVTFTMPGGHTLDRASIADIDPEFEISASGGGSVAFDTSQAPLLLDAATNRYRYWLNTKGTVTGISITPIAKSWAATNTATQQGVPNAGTLAEVDEQLGVHWIDVKLTPTAGRAVSAASVASGDVSISGLNGQQAISASAIAPTQLPGSNVWRFYVTGAFAAGEYRVQMAANSWSDSAGPSSVALDARFAVTIPRIEVSLPFGNATVIDVGAANRDRDTTSTASTKPHYVDITFITPAGTDLDYASIFDPTKDFTLTIGGVEVKLDQPVAIEMVADAVTGRLVAQVVTVTPNATTGALSEADLQKLRTGGIKRFRYRFATDSTVQDWATGAVAVTVADGEWTDMRGNSGLAETRSFTVAGPTATLANPFAGTGIDINLLNRRNWIDVAFPGTTRQTLDMATIADLADAEITLSGAGLGTIQIDPSQAPILIDPATRTVRFFLTGFFLPGTVDIAIAATYKYTGGAAGVSGTGAQTDLHLTNNRTYIDVRFTPTAGDQVVLVDNDNNPNTPAIERTTPADLDNIDGGEFSIAGLDEILNSAKLLSTDAASKVEVWRFFFIDSDEDNATGAEFDAPGTVSVSFAAGSWNATTSTNTTYTNLGFTEEFRVLGPTANLVSPADQATVGARVLNDRGYIDVGFVLPAGKTLDRATVTDLAPEFSLNTSGLTFFLDGTQAPLFLREDGNTVFFRYWTRGSHTSGAVSITFLPLEFGFTDGTLSSAAGSTTPTDFTIGGVATPNITYIDVQLGATAGDALDATSIDDTDAEFTLTGTGVGSAALIDALRPTRLAGTSTYRFYLGGAFAPGPVTVTFAANRFSSNGIQNLLEVETFTVGQLTGELGDPSVGSVVGTNVLNGRGFFDVTYTIPGYASGIDFASITDLEPEFTMTGTAGVTFELDASRAPVYLGAGPNSGEHVFRYFYTGPKTGTATLNFIGNGLRFTNAAGGTVPLFPPIALKVVADGTKKVIDVPFGTFANLAFGDIAAADITSPGLTFAKLSTAFHPSGLVRFEITAGTAKVGDTITVTYAGTWSYGGTARRLDNTGSATLSAGPFLQGVFNPIGPKGLSLPSIIDAPAEIALGGTGIGTVALDTTAARKPDLLSDGRTVRYYLTGNFAPGTVTVDFLAGTWADEAGEPRA